MEKEREKPEGVEERQESPEIPEYIEKAGVRSSAPSATPVADDSGKPLVSPVGDGTQVVLPDGEESLKGWSKGSIKSSLTWLGLFWLRMIKKAIHLGKRVVVKQK